MEMNNPITKTPKISLSDKLRKQNYAAASDINKKTIDTAADADLQGGNKYFDEYDPLLASQNAMDNQPEGSEYESGLSNWELAKNSFQSALIDMNKAQKSNSQGELRIRVIPAIEEIDSKLKLFSDYDAISTQIDQLQNQIATTSGEVQGDMFSALMDLQDQKKSITEGLLSTGVDPQFTNAADIIADLEQEKKTNEKRLSELHENIATDESDIARYGTLDPEYIAGQKINKDFKWGSPSKWSYSLPSVIGASASSAGWQVLPYAGAALRSILAKGLVKAAAGAALGAPAGGVGAIPGAVIGAIGVSADIANAALLIKSNYEQAKNEANAEVSDNFKSRVGDILTQQGIDPKTIADNVRNNPEMSEAIRNASDEDILDMMLDRRIPVDPSITEAEQMARKGTDRLFNQNLAITWASNVAEDLLMVPYFGKIAGKTVTKGLKGIAGVAAPIDALGDVASKELKKQVTKYVLGRNAAAGKITKALAKSAYIAGDLIPKQAAIALSEATEEGAQYTSGKKYQQGLYDEDNGELNLQNIANTLGGAYGEKLTTIANVLGSPFGYQNALYENDLEYWNNVKLGAAASLFSPLQGIATGQAIRSNYKETRGMDIVNNLATTELQTKEDMEKIIGYASGKTKGYEQEVLDAFEKLKSNPDLRNSGLTEEDIQEEIELANKSFSIATNPKFKALAKELDINPETQEFGELAGLALTAEKEFKSSIDVLKESNKALTTVKDKLLKNESFNILISKQITDSISKINNARVATGENTISAEEFAETFSNYLRLSAVNSSLAQLHQILNATEEGSTVSFKGSEFAYMQLIDLRDRLDNERDLLIKQRPSWYNSSENEDIKDAMDSLLDIDLINELNQATENNIIAGATLERNQEIMRAFSGNPGRTLSNLKTLDAIRQAKRSTRKYIKAENRMWDKNGIMLVDELFSLYQDKKGESREQLDAMSGNTQQTVAQEVTAPATPVATVATPVRPIPVAPVAPVVTPTAQPKPARAKVPKIKPSIPQESAMPELSDPDALIAEAEAELGALPRRKTTVKKPVVATPANPTESSAPTTNPDAISQQAPTVPVEQDEWLGAGSITTDESDSSTGASDAAASTIEQKAPEVLSETDKAKQDQLDALNELKDLWNQGSNVGIAFDPEVEAERQAKLTKASFKLISATFKLGYYKFKDFVLSIYNATGQNTDFLSENFDKFKGIYSNYYFSAPEELRTKMSKPGELEDITFFDTVSNTAQPLTNEEKVIETQSGVTAVDKIDNPSPSDAITDAELASFEEMSKLDILNTFHYIPNAAQGETIEFENGKIETFSPNGDLPGLFNSDPTGFTYEYAVANFIDYSTKARRVKWDKPTTYDWARVGIIAAHKSGRRYWVAMRSPNTIKNLGPEEFAEKAPMLRDKRAQIISLFVEGNKIKEGVIARPTKLLLHNAVRGMLNQKQSINSPSLNSVLQMSNNLDEELVNFGYSTGIRSSKFIHNLTNGNATVFKGSTAGGIYYIISGNKRVSNRAIPLNVSMHKYSGDESLAKMLADLVFSTSLYEDNTFTSSEKFRDTDLTPIDVIRFFLNYGLNTEVDTNDENLTENAKANLSSKQLFMKKGTLHYGNNVLKKSGLSAAQVEAEKSYFADWVMSQASMPFKRESKKSPFAVNQLVKDMFGGRLGSSIEKAGGRLELAKGYVFTNEDLNHTLLAWLIKSGLIESNLNVERYNRPFIIADGITLETPTVENKPTITETKEAAPVIVEEAKPKKGFASIKSFKDLNADEGITVDFHRNKKDNDTRTVDIESAKRFLKDKLGLSDSEIRIVDIAIASGNPASTVSHMSEDAITIVNGDAIGVEYHEAFHRVSLLSLSNNERASLYKAYKKANKAAENYSNKQIEEELAEDFRFYMNNESSKWYYGITKFLNKIKTFVDSLFGNYNINSLYRRINQGEFHNYPINKESLATFKEAYGDRANFTQRGHNFKHLPSLDQYNQVIEYLAVAAIEDSLGSSETLLDISKVTFDYSGMKQMLQNLSVSDDATDAQKLMYNELYETFDTVLKPDIVSFADALSLREIEKEEEYESTEERDGGEIEKDNFDKYDSASYEISKLHNIRPAVKLFLSSIKERIFKDGKYYQLFNKHTGIPQVTPFATAWKRIVNQVFDCTSYKDVEYRLAKLAKTDPFYASVYSKLKMIKDVNLQTQILQTITGYRHTFLTVSFDNKGEDGKTLYISTLGGSVDNRNAKKLIADWNRNFYNSTSVTTTETGERVPNKKVLAEHIKTFESIIKEIAGLDDLTGNGQQYDNVINKLVSFLNGIGISIDYDTLNQAVVKDILLNGSVNKPTLVMAAKRLFTNNNYKYSLSRVIPNLLKNPVVKSTANNVRTRGVDNLFTDEGSILSLAFIHYKANSNNLEEKNYGPNNATLYPLSKHNYLTLEVNKLNNDKQYVESLLKVPFNNSSVVLNQIKGNSNTKLSIGTLININEFYGGTGVDYQSAPLVETFIAKYTLSENGILLLPTMSDKKTYMPISGLELFENRSMTFSTENGNLVADISDAATKQFVKYYLSEYRAITQYYRLKDKTIDKSKYITAYLGKGGKDGNGSKFRMMRGYFRNENGTPVYHSFSDMTIDDLNAYFNNQKQLEEDVKTMLNYYIDKQMKYVASLGLIEKNKNGKWENKNFPVNGLDRRKIVLQNAVPGLSEEDATHLGLVQSIAGFTVNHFVSMFESAKVMYKDEAFYKNYGDVSKRLAGVLSTGDKARTDFPAEHFMSTIARYRDGNFRVAGLKDIKLRTNQPEELYKAVYNAYVREYLEDSGKYTKEQVDELTSAEDLFLSKNIPTDIKKEVQSATERDLSLYGAITRTEEGDILVDEAKTPINQADASVYVTPQMYKAILATQGMLSADVEAAIDYVEENADNMSDITTYSKTLAAAMHPLKMVYFGNEVINIEGEHINPAIFNKMAIFPLFKVFTSGDLRVLYDRMTDKVDPWDMVTTTSAVKVGNIEEYDFYTDATQNEITGNFKKDEKGNYSVLATRLQKFENLLNQMPIEAHEAERRMLVTQAMKTVYSNIRLDGDYYLPNGRKVSGIEMRDLAMKAIDRLSDIGLDKIMKDLNVVKDDNGNYTFEDLKGLSDKLVRDMKSSGMDSDIREQVELNENNEFNVPLSASPVAKQLVTKIISGVNKETVDINLPGGTFVQMSSFGLKSIAKETLQDVQSEVKGYKLNNGNRLKLKNDDNSMDCVISINLLKPIIPNFDNITFLEARQWLFDNNIIGEGESVSPCSMGYRVPTQGMSSIAALKIKDVLPSQIGDTIVLPDEFTARTGSDFDIDKLFLTRYNYRVTKSEDGTYTATKYEYDFNKPVEENRKEAIENLLIDTFMASLLDDKNVHDSNRPLDVPVDIAKTVANKYQADGSSKEAMSEYTAYHQDRIKQDFADSKSGIGPFALNNPHHVLGQLIQLIMKSPDFMPNLGNLHKTTGVDGIHILDWLSAMISAHVDVAKDNYIIKLNVNSYTYNTTNFLFRNGVGKNTLFFVSQPIMKALANAYIQSKGTYGMEKSTTASSRFKEQEDKLVKSLTDKLKLLAKTSEQKTALEELLKNERIPDEILFEKEILGEPVYLEELLQKEKDKDFAFYYGQLLVYKLHKQMMPMAVAMSDLVKATQIDTKKFGKNSIQMREFLRKVDALYTNGMFSEEMVSDMFNKTFLAKKLENSVNFTLDLLANVSIQSKESYYRLFRGLINSVGLSQVSGDRTIGDVTSAIDGSWRSMALYKSEGSNYLTGGNTIENLRSLFVGTNTLAKQLNILKDDIIKNQDKYPEISITNGRISNLFLNSISGITGNETGLDYIRVDYSDEVSSNVSRQLREYWQELIDSPNEKLHNFGIDLVKYAVFTGHGNRHLNSLFDFIPSRTLKDLGYYENVRDLEKDTESNFLNRFDKDELEEIYKNNWFNDTLVPVVNAEKTKKLFGIRNVNGREIRSVFALIGTSRRPLTKNEDGVQIYSPFIKIRSKSIGGYDLYKYVGTFTKMQGKKEISSPLYVAVNKKGIKQPARSVISEYLSPAVFGSYEASRQSIIPGNNVAPKYKEGYLEDNPKAIKKFVDENTKANGAFTYLDTIEYIFGDYVNNREMVGEDIIDENDEQVPNMGVETETETEEQNTFQSQPINIYAGTGENAELSNFAIRPFSVPDIGSFEYEDEDLNVESERIFREIRGKSFKTVEGAFQAAKLAYALDLNVVDIEIFEKSIQTLKTATGAQAKQIGSRTRIEKIIEATNENFFDRWSDISSLMMKFFMQESFKQNPEAIQKLLDTGDATLTHTQDKGKWGKEFPRLLMEVRSELQNLKESTETDSVSELDKLGEQRKKEC